MNTGLRLVRKELGPDALILSTKTVKNGKLGLLGKSTIEITAAIDSSWPQDPPQTDGKTSYSQWSVRHTGQSRNNKRIDFTLDDSEITLDYSDEVQVQQENREIRQMLTSPERSKDQPDLANQALRSEVSELKELVQQLAGQISDRDDANTPAAPAPETHSALGTQPTGESLRQRLGSINSTREPLLQLLRGHGIEGEPALVIADFIRENIGSHDIGNPETIRRFVIQIIEDLIDVKPPEFEQSKEQARIALIGPTGVGKTTTLAKLAAHYLTNYSDSMALITIDTYRIAAVEQIKVYAEIMHLPVEVVISPEQLEEALAKHADKKLVLIDTAGRSPKDTLSAIELSLFLRPDLNIEKHLVLSASTRENELLDTIHHFEKVGIDKTIFTKVDECSNSGVIFNIQTQNSYPLSYITNGQRVPEDFLQITRRSVAEFIMTPPEGIPNE